MRKTIKSLLTATMILSLPLAVIADDQDEEKEWEMLQKKTWIFLKENIPSAAKNLVEIKTESIEEYEEHIKHWIEFMEEYYENLKHNPAAAKLMLLIHQAESKVDTIVEKIHETDDKELKKKLKAKLEPMLDKIFDMQMKARTIEMEALKDELEEVQSMIKKRNANKAKIIKRHIKNLLEEDDDLSWW